MLKNKNDVHTSTNMFSNEIKSSSETGTANAKDAVVSAAVEATPPAPDVTLPHTSPPAHVNDFRPTTPGHSPGIGNSIQN